MPVNPADAVGAELAPDSFSWNADDVLLYHLAVGAGDDPTSPSELRYATEQELVVLPTFGLLAPAFRIFEPPRLSLPGVEVDLAAVLHGAQDLVVHRPIPVGGRAELRSRIADVLDKGSAAVILMDTEAHTESGEALFTARTSIFARGEGGFGGARGPSARAEPAPSGPVDVEVTIPTVPQQALWYRLCGDRNPLHSDPEFARAAGFTRPILHGLCTYSMACKALVDALLDADPGRVTRFSARFAGVVYPGETLHLRAWRRHPRTAAAHGSREWALTVTVVEREALVLADGVFAATG